MHPAADHRVTVRGYRSFNYTQHEPPPFNAVVSGSAGVSGSLASLEALYFLTGMKTQTLGRIFHQNLVAYDHTYFVGPRDPSERCEVCGVSAE